MVSVSESRHEPSRKHHSFLHILDNITNSSADLSFTPFTTRQKNNATIRGLSNTLHSLASNVDGLKHLPEVSASSHVAESSIACRPEASLGPVVCTYVASMPDTKRSLDQNPDRQFETFAPLSLRGSFDLDPFVDISQHELNRDNNTISHLTGTSVHSNSHALPHMHQSRPVSACSTSSIGITSTHCHRESRDVKSNHCRPGRRPASFEDQRYEIIGQNEEQQTNTHSSPHRFNFMRTFKDLNAKLEKRRKTKHHRLGPVQHSGMVSLLSLQEALRAGVRLKSMSATAEVDVSNSKLGGATAQAASTLTLTEPASNLTTDTSAVDSTLKAESLLISTTQSPNRVEDTATPCSVDLSSSPYTTSDQRIIVSNSHIVRQMIEFTAQNTMKSPANVGKAGTVFVVSDRIGSPPPTAPPARPLPRLPDKNGTCNTKFQSRVGRRRKVMGERSTRCKRPGRIMPSQSRATHQNRVRDVDSSKGSSIDFSDTESVLPSWLRADPENVPLSPVSCGQPREDLAPLSLKLRSTRTERIAKVQELKQRHVLMHSKDTASLAPGIDEDTDTIDEGLFSMTTEMSIPEHTKANQAETRTCLKRLLSDRSKPLPLPPIRTHNRRDSATLPQLLCRENWCSERTSLQPIQSAESLYGKPAWKQTTVQSNVIDLGDSGVPAHHSCRAQSLSPDPFTAQKLIGSIVNNNPSCQQKAYKLSCCAPEPSRSCDDNGASVLPSGDVTILHKCAESHQDVLTKSILMGDTPQGRECQNSNGMKSEIDRLNYELGRMTRVYNVMAHARQGLPCQDPRSYSELLLGDRRASHVAQLHGRQHSLKQAMGETLPGPRSAASSPGLPHAHTSSTVATPRSFFDSTTILPTRARTANDSDVSISTSTSISFESTSSSSSRMRTRKYSSDGSLTDPNEYDSLSYSTPLGSSQTTIKPPKRILSSTTNNPMMSTIMISKPSASEVSRRRKPRRSIMSAYSPYPRCTSSQENIGVQAPNDIASGPFQATVSTIALTSVPTSPPTIEFIENSSATSVNCD